MYHSNIHILFRRGSLENRARDRNKIVQPSSNFHGLKCQGPQLSTNPRSWNCSVNNIYYLVLRKLTYIKWSNAHSYWKNAFRQVLLIAFAAEIKCCAWLLKSKDNSSIEQSTTHFEEAEGELQAPTVYYHYSFLNIGITGMATWLWIIAIKISDKFLNSKKKKPSTTRVFLSKSED